jgi:hypothetical protein
MTEFLFLFLFQKKPFKVNFNNHTVNSSTTVWLLEISWGGVTDTMEIFR